MNIGFCVGDLEKLMKVNYGFGVNEEGYAVGISINFFFGLEAAEEACKEKNYDALFVDEELCKTERINVKGATGCRCHVVKFSDHEEIIEEKKELLNWMIGKRKQEKKVDIKGLRLYGYRIIYLEAKSYDKLVVIHTVDEDYKVKSTFKDICEILEKEEFFQPHKSYLVNPTYIACVKDDHILLKNQEQIPISRRCKAEAVRIGKLYYAL